MTGHTCMGIASGFLTDGWTSSCSCGWESVPQAAATTAMGDYYAHVASEQAKADAVAAGMSSCTREEHATVPAQIKRLEGLLRDRRERGATT